VRAFGKATLDLIEKVGFRPLFGISIDSFQEDMQRKMGRCQRNGSILSKSDYLKLCGSIQENSVSLKINMVVTVLNITTELFLS
jgi:hypothetical protein